MAGSLVLLGGPPGIGKSTLLLQAAAAIRRSGGRALYVSGEESAPQVRLRAERVSAEALDVDFLGATDVEELIRAAESSGPDFLGVDSIQTLTSSTSDASPGTISQVRECAAALQEYAKSSLTPVVIVGHVTKGGALAGPRTLEHLVDAVLHFEGSRSHEHRLLRATKNRFGSVDEVAVFRMTGEGLAPVENPSEVFLSAVGEFSGSAVAVTFQGTRPLLAEVQCLTATSRHGNPRRTTTGFPPRTHLKGKAKNPVDHQHRQLVFDLARIPRVGNLAQPLQQNRQHRPVNLNLLAHRLQTRRFLLFLGLVRAFPVRDARRGGHF